VLDESVLAFIVRAKANTWNSDGSASLAYRPGSHDLQYHEGDRAYLDSYFGSTEFVGQEVVWERNTPLWVMNYHGRILRPDDYDGARAGATSQYGRGRMYETGTFMGDHSFTYGHVIFRVESTGSADAFTGLESHEIEGVTVYHFRFHGGSVYE
jgi:Domain of unknown function (DUF5680)